MATRILGIDPSLRSTGYGIIETGPGLPPRTLAFGAIPNPASRPQPEALAHIAARLRELIAEHRPGHAALEKIIYVQSVRTAITLGAARGAALIAAAEAGLPVTEYPARLIKLSATGFGAAQKSQVAFMIRALLGLRETPSPDAADALAIALTHARRLQAA